MTGDLLGVLACFDFNLQTVWTLAPKKKLSTGCCATLAITGESKRSIGLYGPMGNFSRVEGLTQNGRAVFRNAAGLFMYWWLAAKAGESSWWKIGRDYKVDASGYKSDSLWECPNGTKGWQLFDGDYWFQAEDGQRAGDKNFTVDCVGASSRVESAALDCRNIPPSPHLRRACNQPILSPSPSPPPPPPPHLLMSMLHG